MFVSYTMIGLILVVIKSLCYSSCVLLLVHLFYPPTPLLPYPLTFPILHRSCINQVCLSLLKFPLTPIQFPSLICHPISWYFPPFVVPFLHVFFMLGIFLLPSNFESPFGFCLCLFSKCVLAFFISCLHCYSFTAVVYLWCVFTGLRILRWHRLSVEKHISVCMTTRWVWTETWPTSPGTIWTVLWTSKQRTRKEVTAVKG